MQVICVDNSEVENQITQGKSYTVEELTLGQVALRDDLGKISWFNFKRFRTEKL